LFSVRSSNKKKIVAIRSTPSISINSIFNVLLILEGQIFLFLIIYIVSLDNLFVHVSFMSIDFMFQALKLSAPRMARKHQPEIAKKNHAHNNKLSGRTVRPLERIGVLDDSRDARSLVERRG